MNAILKFLDQLWNLKFLTGVRHRVAQGALGLLVGYQELATSPEITKGVYDLPDIPTAIYVALSAYFIGKVTQFAKEHKPTITTVPPAL